MIKNYGVFALIGGLLIVGLFVITTKSPLHLSQATLSQVKSRSPSIFEKAMVAHAVDSQSREPAANPSQGSVKKTTDLSAQEQVQILDSILRTHNDNDKRMDSKLAFITEPARIIFREKYKKIDAEERNQRGTIVFLLGRSIENSDDVKFMGEVLNEPPCMSFQDCKLSMPDSDAHHQGTNEMTLAYPQMVALHSLEVILESQSYLSAEAQTLVYQASRSDIPIVARYAQRILDTLKNQSDKK